MSGNKAIFDTAMKRAHEYAWANQWERAMKEYVRALTEFPDDMTARRNMAQSLFRLRRWDEALAAYEELVKAEPNDLFGINRLAEIHLASQHLDLAKSTYMRLADLYTAKNQYHEAIRALRDLARATPKDKEVPLVYSTLPRKWETSRRRQGNTPAHRQLLLKRASLTKPRDMRRWRRFSTPRTTK